MPPLLNLLDPMKHPDTYSMTSKTTVALQVVPVKIMNNDGHSVTTYPLLETGSEETFLPKAISDRLGLEVNNCKTFAVCTLSGPQ